MSKTVKGGLQMSRNLLDHEIKILYLSWEKNTKNTMIRTEKISA